MPQQHETIAALLHQMYIGDYNDWLPPNFGVGGNAAATNCWVTGSAQNDTTTLNIQSGVLFQYNRSTTIYACPANTKMIPGTGLPPNNQPVPQTRTCSIEYSMGGNSAGTATGPWTISRGGITFNSYPKAAQVQSVRASKKLACLRMKPRRPSMMATLPSIHWWIPLSTYGGICRATAITMAPPGHSLTAMPSITNGMEVLSLPIKAMVPAAPGAATIRATLQTICPGSRLEAPSILDHTLEAHWGPQFPADRCF